MIDICEIVRPGPARTRTPLLLKQHKPRKDRRLSAIHGLLIVSCCPYENVRAQTAGPEPCTGGTDEQGLTGVFHTSSQVLCKIAADLCGRYADADAEVFLFAVQIRQHKHTREIVGSAASIRPFLPRIPLRPGRLPAPTPLRRGLPDGACSCQMVDTPCRTRCQTAEERPNAMVLLTRANGKDIAIGGRGTPPRSSGGDLSVAVNRDRCLSSQPEGATHAQTRCRKRVRVSGTGSTTRALTCRRSEEQSAAEYVPTERVDLPQYAIATLRIRLSACVDADDIEAISAEAVDVALAYGRRRAAERDTTSWEGAR